MTAEECEALAFAAWGARAAVVAFGADRCVVGQWTPVGELDSASGVVLRTDRQAIDVKGDAPTWGEAARRAGLLKLAATIGTSAIVLRKRDP